MEPTAIKNTFANQDNINKYAKAVQKNSFLDVSYERLVKYITTKKYFLKTTNLILENSFPISNLVCG